MEAAIFGNSLLCMEIFGKHTIKYLQSPYFFPLCATIVKWCTLKMFKQFVPNDDITYKAIEVRRRRR